MTLDRKFLLLRLGAHLNAMVSLVIVEETRSKLSCNLSRVYFVH